MMEPESDDNLIVGVIGAVPSGLQPLQKKFA